MENMQYNSMNIVGTVVSDPIRKGKNFSFDIENRRGNHVLPFFVFVRNDERPIDVNEGDQVVITNAVFYFDKDGKNCLAVVEGSCLEVIRKRCNMGEVEV